MYSLKGLCHDVIPVFGKFCTDVIAWCPFVSLIRAKVRDIPYARAR